MNYNRLSTSQIIAYSPDNPLLASLTMLLLYAVKTISVIFPYKVLQLATGMMFPLFIAVCVNTAGTTVSCTVGYYMGHFLGRDISSKIIVKNKKLVNILKRQNNSILFFSFFLRSLVFLPLDAVSIYFGAVKSDFRKYMLGSILGLLPNIIISTILGENISDPTSPQFLLSMLLFLLISIISLIWYLKYMKREEQ
jgi:uncharacterized membrane protein YdjX (TVP38/TMEM64 family)